MDLVSIFDKLVQKRTDNKVLTSDDRTCLNAALQEIDCTTAANMHKSLLWFSVSCDMTEEEYQIQIKSFENNTNLPLRKWAHDKEAAARLVSTFTEVGTFACHVADAACMSPRTRRIAWNEEEDEMEEIAKAQKKLSAMHVQQAKKRPADTEKYTRAYHIVKRKKNLPKNEEWVVVISSALSELLTKPPPFWAKVRIQSLNELNQRAVLYKIKMYEKEYGRSALPDTFRLTCKYSREELLFSDSVFHPGMAYHLQKIARHKIQKLKTIRNTYFGRIIRRSLQK